MGHKHTKEQILEGALATALDDGLSQLTFGRVAKRLGINDRIVVYYFPTKDDLVAEVLISMGLQLQETLAAAFTAQAADHSHWCVLPGPCSRARRPTACSACSSRRTGSRPPGASPTAPWFRRWCRHGSTGRRRSSTGPAKQRRIEAETAIAMIDGLLLLRQLAGPAAADRAARRLGVR